MRSNSWSHSWPKHKEYRVLQQERRDAAAKESAAKAEADAAKAVVEAARTAIAAMNNDFKAQLKGMQDEIGFPNSRRAQAL